MIFRGLSLRWLSSFKFGVLMLFIVVSPSAVSHAGVMISPTETDTGMVAAANWAFPVEADHNNRNVVESSDQEYGMTVTSGGGGGSTVLALIDDLDRQLAEIQLVQWLVSQRRVIIPNSIPICLLKVPIVVA